jgi:selenocysteine lyase/cysteine desulfurase
MVVEVKGETPEDSMCREPAMASTTRAEPGARRDLERWRADTPGCTDRIHLNNAGAALVPNSVADTVTRHLELESKIGGYEAAETVTAQLSEVYAALAGLLGAESRNVAVAANSTIAFAQALSSFALGRGDRILTTRNDYASNQIMYLSLADRFGVDIERAEDLPEGGVDPQSIREAIRRRRPALVSVTWIPTNSGLVQPVEAVGEICEEAGVPYLVDACQAVGQVPIDVARVRCDYLAASARKFLRGPRGIGFLYASDRALQKGAYPLYVDMHGANWTDPDAFELTPDARRFETWESPCAVVLGMGAAARYAADVGIATARDRARRLAQLARRLLAELPGVRVLDRGADLCAIVTAALPHPDPEAIKLELRARAVNVSVTTRTSAVIDMDEKHASAALRFSPHYYNTEEELERAVGVLGEILKKRER